MFNDRRGRIWWRVWLKLEERRESFCHLLCPRPLSAQVWFMATYTMPVSQTKPPWRVMAQRWWTHGRCSSLSPARLDLAVKHILGWLKQLLCDPNKTGEKDQNPCLRRKAGHITGCNSAVRGHKASLESGCLSDFRSHSGAPPLFSSSGEK